MSYRNEFERSVFEACADAARRSVGPDEFYYKIKSALICEESERTEARQTKHTLGDLVSACRRALRGERHLKVLEGGLSKGVECHKKN